jgi:hypothetical protein
MKHPSEQQWMDFLYKELSAPEEAETEAHLAKCPICAKQLESRRATMKTLDTWSIPAFPKQRPARITSPWRWVAAAAVVMLTTGFAVGRLSSSRPDLKQIQASISEPLRQSIKQELEQQFKAQLATALENSRAEIAAALSAKLDAASQRLLAESINGAKNQVDALAATLAALREEDKKAVAAAFNDIEQQRINDRRDLEKVALNTEQGFRTAQRQLVQLAEFTQTPDRQ